MRANDGDLPAIVGKVAFYFQRWLFRVEIHLFHNILECYLRWSQESPEVLDEDDPATQCQDRQMVSTRGDVNLTRVC